MTTESVRLAEAEATCRAAIERDPHTAKAHYDLAFLLAGEPARAAEAEAAYRQAIALEPNNARYVYRLGLLLHEQLQLFADAENAYRRALALAPDDPFYYSGLLVMLVEQSRRPEALALAVKSRALLSAAEHWYGLATLDAILGNTDAALEHLAQAARADNFDRAWARIDPDLASIRADPRFSEMVAIG